MRITILSICGPSAVGKTTLIKYLNENKEIRSIFGLTEGREIITTGDGFKPIEEIKNDINDTDCYILHKWQRCDKDELKEIKDLREKFPNATHKIIVLWLPWENWWYGFRSKHNDNKEPMEIHINWWYKTIIPELQEIGLPIEHYEMIYPKSGRAAKYSKLEKMPKEPQCR